MLMKWPWCFAAPEHGAISRGGHPTWQNLELREAANGRSLGVALRSPIKTTIRRGFVKMGISFKLWNVVQRVFFSLKRSPQEDECFLEGKKYYSHTRERGRRPGVTAHTWVPRAPQPRCCLHLGIRRWCLPTATSTRAREQHSGVARGTGTGGCEDA
jgi:hypothetical protein